MAAAEFINALDAGMEDLALELAQTVHIFNPPEDIIIRLFHRAVYNGFARVVSALLAAGVDPTACFDSGWAPIHNAALQGHTDILKTLLDAGANINAQDDEGETALTCACLGNHWHIVDLLINLGADVNMYGSMSPLHCTAAGSKCELTKRLIHMGANIDAQTTQRDKLARKGWTALHFAARLGRQINLGILLNEGADPNIKDEDGKTALHLAVVDWQNFAALETVPYLLKHEADALAKDNSGHTPLGTMLLRKHKTKKEHSCDMGRVHMAISLLVAAGDRNWECVPVPCFEIERALLPVWREAPDELSEVYKRLTRQKKQVFHILLRAMHRKEVPEELRMLVLDVAMPDTIY